MSSWRRRSWILPLAALVPAAAIVFAVSMGPSPRKYLAQLPQEDGMGSEQALSLLRQAPMGVEPVLIEALALGTPELSSDLRSASIALLGERGFRPAARVLEGLLQNPSEGPELKATALRSLVAIDQGLGTRWAMRYLGQPGPLGRQAQTLVGPSAKL